MDLPFADVVLVKAGAAVSSTASSHTTSEDEKDLSAFAVSAERVIQFEPLHRGIDSSIFFGLRCV